MSFIRYVFSFLYVRNWYTGERELSRPRVFVFVAGLGLLVLAFLIIAFLQAPVVYERV